MTGRPGDEPFLSMWFGNFFEPFYSDFDATARGVADIAALGFTSINLDSKAWEDFFARYRGEPASQYVAMQELMMSEAASHGMDYTALALYLCGDNLYPGIRDVPPVRGEEAIRTDGAPMGTYKYWSPTAQASMVEHVHGLLRLYGDGMHRMADGRVVMQTMFDPIVKPSFDDEGRAHYLGWLEGHYRGDINALNTRYVLKAASYSDLKPDAYWLRPDELNWVGCARPTTQDFAERTADFYRWVDNQTYLAHVTVQYFETMRTHWRQTSPPLFVEPVLHQWGYFFNPPGQPDWQTGQRALDIYHIAPHVDGVLFITSPLDAENRPNAAALSVEVSIARTANEHHPFTGGVYLGRHVNEDVYAAVPPAEALATHIAGGATRLHTYGYSGLDDGGVMFRMDDLFRQSVKDANQWAKDVIPLLSEPRTREAAILFPAEMSVFEPVEVDHEGRHRMDLLGWYQQLTDLGWHVDVVHPHQVLKGALRDYQHLVVPTNSLYDLGDNAALEQAVHKFVVEGGTVLHGPECQLAEQAFGIEQEDVAFDVIAWSEEVIPHGWSTVAFSTGEAFGTYIQSGRAAFTELQVGSGRVYSFGFQYGYAYSRRTMPIVPPQYGRREMHPIVLLHPTPVESVIGASPSAVLPPMRGVETARFGNSVIVVNHRSSPINIAGIPTRRQVPLVPSAPGLLAAHSATYIELLPTPQQPGPDDLRSSPTTRSARPHIGRRTA